MASDITVRFGADIGSLQAGTQAAGQAVDVFAAKVEGLRQALGANNFTPLEANVEQLRARFSTFGEAVSAIGDQARAGLVPFEEFNPIMGQLRSAFDDAAEGGHGLSLATAAARREMMVLGHEALTGNWTRFGPSLMVLAERMGGLSVPTMAAGAAIAALGYAAYEAIRHIDDLADAVDRVQAATVLSGAKLDPAAIEGLIGHLKDLSGVSTQEASTIVANFARIRGASGPEIQALVDALDPLAAAMGVKTPQAAQQLGAAFAEPATNGRKLLTTLGAAPPVIDAFTKAIDDGNQSQGLRILMRQLTDTASAAADFDAKMIDGLSLSEKWALRQKTLGAGKDATPGNMAKTMLGGDDAAAAPTLAAPSVAPMDSLRTQASTIRDDISKTDAQIASDTVAFWEKQKEAYSQAGQSTIEIDRQIQSARVALARQTSGEVVAEIDAETQRRIAAGTMGRAQELSIEVEADRRKLADARVSADEKVRISRDESVKVAQLHAEAANGQIRSLQTVAAATRAASQERIAAEGAVYAYAEQTWGAESAQATAALDKMNAAVRAYQAEQDRMAQERRQTDAEVARINLQTEKDGLDAEVAAGRMTNEQKIQALQQLTDEDYQQTLQRLDIEDAGLEQGTQAWERALQRRATLAAQYEQDSARLADQEAQAHRQAAEETARQWEQAFSPINRGMDAMVQGIVMGTETMRQVAARAASDFLMEELSADARWLEHKLITNALGLASDQQAAEGGMLAWVWAELTKTAATESGNATRAASDAASQSTFLGRVAEQLAQWLGLEGSKTTATVAESGTRDAAEGASAIASIMASKAEAVGEIPAYAAIAAVAAMSSVAAIPVVGWAMAPGVGQATFQQGLSYLGLASAAGGWERVPYDGALTELHKDEMVLPAAIAEPLRAALKGPALGLPASMTSIPGPTPSSGASPSGDGAGNGGGEVHFHVNALDGHSVVSVLSNPQTLRWLSTNLQSYWGANPSTRGNY
ncbi:MAG: hypothetical protein M0006_03300 [Magnetospirillum sp.]|nr:hypothetical protein [Magnetospirillum sp.]